jgi:CDP-diacylglycerol--glycerol-3-phosphate 3-phosphatidyltransferase
LTGSVAHCSLKLHTVFQLGVDVPTTSSANAISQATIPPWKKKLPMWLTWARIGISPVIVVLICFENPVNDWLTAILFILASITDWLDGSLARKYKAQTNMGKFMDPIADKILVASVLIMLVPSGRVGPVLVLLLLVRDILIGGVRSVAAADGLVIDAKSAGKWKTALQMVGIPMLLINKHVLLIPFAEIGLGLMWFSVVLSLFSGWQYIQMYGESKSRSV